jgi:hypothetical protein
LLKRDIENLLYLPLSIEGRQTSVKRIMAAITGTLEGYEKVKEKVEFASSKLQQIRKDLVQVQAQIDSLPHSWNSSGEVTSLQTSAFNNRELEFLSRKETLTKTAEKIEHLLYKWGDRSTPETRALHSLIDFVGLFHGKGEAAWPPGTAQGGDVKIDYPPAPHSWPFPDPDGMLQATYNAVLAAWKKLKDQLGLNDYLR